MFALSSKWKVILKWWPVNQVLSLWIFCNVFLLNSSASARRSLNLTHWPFNLFISVTLNELSLQSKNTDANLAKHWPSWINAALCSRAEHWQPKAPCSTESNSFSTTWDLELHLCLCFGHLPPGPPVLHRPGGDSAAQVTEGGLTQLGPGNSSLPTTPPQEA